mmetsp:Transcript_72855/g.170616  ORF Transcript_72855/g.170616 Transcript_72855/m.170616 type:complete len:294 (+) Transcript_72855:600-1481(+)
MQFPAWYEVLLPPCHLFEGQVHSRGCIVAALDKCMLQGICAVRAPSLVDVFNEEKVRILFATGRTHKGFHIQCGNLLPDLQPVSRRVHGLQVKFASCGHMISNLESCVSRALVAAETVDGSVHCVQDTDVIEANGSQIPSHEVCKRVVPHLKSHMPWHIGLKRGAIAEKAGDCNLDMLDKVHTSCPDPEMCELLLKIQDELLPPLDVADDKVHARIHCLVRRPRVGIAIAAGAVAKLPVVHPVALRVFRCVREDVESCLLPVPEISVRVVARPGFDQILTQTQLIEALNCCTV